MQEEGYTDNLILNANKIHFSYSNFVRNYWNPTLKELGIDHTSHETRHTCTALLEIAGEYNPKENFRSRFKNGCY